MQKIDDSKFKMGPRKVSVHEILGSESYERIQKKFESSNSADFHVVLQELIKYLYLAAHAPNGVFFPGTQFMDDIWHALIVETAGYRDICNRIRSGIFIDHTGLKYNAYVDILGPDQVHAEQASWLCSYLHNFGELNSDAFKCLTLAQAIAGRMGFTLDELNSYGNLLMGLTQSSANESLEFDVFLNKIVSPIAQILDQDRISVSSVIRQILSKVEVASNEPKLLSPEQLENVYGVSAALAFTINQHLAAVERLSGLTEWQIQNADLWKKISSGSLLCGLATTHLAKPGGSSLNGIETENGYSINGASSWVCGHEIFDKLIVGFETTDKIVFGIIDFPTADVSGIQLTVQKMIALNGMGTLDLAFSDFSIESKFVISSRLKNEGPVKNRPSKYSLPDLGLTRSLIDLTSNIIENSLSPRHQKIKESIGLLRDRFNTIIELREKKHSLGDLIALKDMLNLDAANLLALAEGANFLKTGSISSRKFHEAMFLQNPVQPTEAIDLKIKILSSGNRNVKS